MKKLFLLVLVFASLITKAQYPVLQSLGSDSTLVTSKGAFKSRLINFPFTDTTQANTNRIKFYDGAQIYTKSGGAKFWIRDSALNKWVQLQAGAATAFVDSITLSSSQTTDTLKYWKAGTGTTVGYIDRPDGLIQGGIVTWSGVGLIYDITSAIYWINNVRYTSAAQSVTLAAADPSDPTIYTFYLDNTGTFGAIRGTPDPDPVETLPDAATQLYRGFVLVDAGATTPTNLPNIIYDENLGPTSEWTGQSVGGTTNFGGVTNPFNGTKTTDIGAFTTGKTVTYVDFTNFQTTSYNTLKMYIRLKAAFANNTNINLQFLNGATVVSNSVVLAATHGFVKSTVGTYQNISVLLNAFTFTSNTVDRLKITFTGSNASGLYIDYVQLQAGTNNNGSGGPWEPVITPANLPNGYWNRYKQFVAFNTDSIQEGSTNLFFTGPRAVSALSGQNISIFNNNSLYQTSTNLHDSLDIVNARIDSLAALRDTTYTTVGIGTGANTGKPLFAFRDIVTNTDSLALDTTLMATRAYVLNNAGGGGTVTTVTGTSPIVSSGGTTPAISLNTVPETKGGTNQTAYATGDILYASASNTLSKLAIGTAAQRLAVVGGVPAWRDTAAVSTAGDSAIWKNDGTYTANRSLTLGSFSQTFARTGLAAGTSGLESVILGNNTAATSGATVQNSSSALFRGRAWNTTVPASQTVDFQIYTTAVSGAAVSGSLNISSSMNGGAFANQASLSSTGILGVPIVNAATTMYSPLTSGTQLVGGQATTSSTIYRLTAPGGSSYSPFIIGYNTTTTAGTLSLCYDATNQLTFNALDAVTPYRVARAGIGITNLVNTIGAESGDMYFSTQRTAGAAISESMRLTSGGALGIGGTPNTAALLDITSTTKGLLLPRMTKTQRDAITSPVAGLMIWQTDNTPGPRWYDGTNWNKVALTTD